MAGPLAAGWLIVRGGYRWPFWLMAILPAVSASLLVTRRWQQPLPTFEVDTMQAHERGPVADDIAQSLPQAAVSTQPSQETAWSRIGTVVRSPGVWLASLTCLISVVPFTVTASFLPVLLKTRGLSAASISLQVTVRSASVALFSLLTGPMVRARYRATLLGLSALLGTVALFLIPVVAGGRLTVLPMLLFGFCGGAMHNVQMAVAGEAVARQHRALAMALVGSVGNIAMTLIPVVHGWMASVGWLEQAFPATGVVLGLIGLVAWRWCAVMHAGARPAGAMTAEATPAPSAASRSNQAAR